MYDETYSMGGARNSTAVRWTALAVGAAIVAATAILLVAGSDESGPARQADAAAANVVQAGAPGEPSRTLTSDELDDVRVPKHTPADVEFAQGMIHHHAQALQMAGFVPDRAIGRDVPLLAERIDVSQRSEIELMERWLTDRGEEVPDPQEHMHGHGGERMPGMLTEAELARLEAASGPRFNRHFLRFMIRHHQGAITMVEQLRRANGGMEPEMDKLARDVETDQAIEMARMRGLLARR